MTGLTARISSRRVIYFRLNIADRLDKITMAAEQRMTLLRWEGKSACREMGSYEQLIHMAHSPVDHQDRIWRNLVLLYLLYLYWQTSSVS